MPRQYANPRPRTAASVLAAAALAAGALFAPTVAMADPVEKTPDALASGGAVGDQAPAHLTTSETDTAPEELTPADLAELAEAGTGSDDIVRADDVSAQGVTASIRTKRGAAYFYHWGDKLRASDYLRDGYGIRAEAIVGGKKYTVHNTSGADTGQEIGLDLPEGKVVWLTLCYTDNGKTVKCSSAVEGRS